MAYTVDVCAEEVRSAVYNIRSYMPPMTTTADGETCLRRVPKRKTGEKKGCVDAHIFVEHLSLVPRIPRYTSTLYIYTYMIHIIHCNSYNLARSTQYIMKAPTLLSDTVICKLWFNKTQRYKNAFVYQSHYYSHYYYSRGSHISKKY